MQVARDIDIHCYFCRLRWTCKIISYCACFSCLYTVPHSEIHIHKLNACKFPAVQHHMNYLDNMFEFINGTYKVQHVYDMGPDLRGYAAIMNEQ